MALIRGTRLHPGLVGRFNACIHIFIAAEIVAIIDQARTLPSVYGLRGLTCSTLGLIAVTGFRISELPVSSC